MKNGIITWENQQIDYPSCGPDMPEFEPRGRAELHFPGMNTVRASEIPLYARPAMAYVERGLKPTQRSDRRLGQHRRRSGEIEVL